MKKNVPLLETDSTLDRQNFPFGFVLNWLVEQTDLNSDALVHLKLMLLPTWILLPTWMLLPTLDVLTNIGRGYIFFKFKFLWGRTFVLSCIFQFGELCCLKVQ